MILKNDFNKTDQDYLTEEKKGLDRAINNLDKRYQNKEVEKDFFLKQNEEYAKRQVDLKKRINKLDRK